MIHLFLLFLSLRYLAIDVLLNHEGISKKYDLPAQLSLAELKLLDLAFIQLIDNVTMALTWHKALLQEECKGSVAASQVFFGCNRLYDRICDCTVHLTPWSAMYLQLLEAIFELSHFCFTILLLSRLSLWQAPFLLRVHNLRVHVLVVPSE